MSTIRICTESLEVTVNKVLVLDNEKETEQFYICTNDNTALESSPFSNYIEFDVYGADALVHLADALNSYINHAGLRKKTKDND